MPEGSGRRREGDCEVENDPLSCPAFSLCRATDFDAHTVEVRDVDCASDSVLGI